MKPTRHFPRIQPLGRCLMIRLLFFRTIHIISPLSFATADPPHDADIAETFAGLPAPIFLAPVFNVGLLFKVKHILFVIFDFLHTHLLFLTDGVIAGLGSSAQPVWANFPSCGHPCPVILYCKQTKLKRCKPAKSREFSKCHFANIRKRHCYFF